jgi:probable DNA metabolism protein
MHSEWLQRHPEPRRSEDNVLDMNPTRACLTGEIDLAGFRAESGDLLAQQVHPSSVEWLTRKPDLSELYASPLPPSASRPKSVARAASAIVPASFLRLCESVVLHREPERFSLLYRLLWRLIHEPNLRNDPVDADMMRAQHLAHAVRRDIHKIKAYLKFVPIDDRMQVAFFEPSHHVLETVAPWFARKFPDHAWVIFTPERSVRFDGTDMHYGPGLARGCVPADGNSAAWQACIDETFRRQAAAGA